MYLAIRIFYGRVPKNAILVGFYYESSMILYKVEVGSAMYKEGFRWTESIDIHGKTGISQCMVLDYILTISLGDILRPIKSKGLPDMIFVKKITRLLFWEQEFYAKNT